MWPGLWSHKLQTNLNIQSIQPHLYPSFHKWQSSFNITFTRRRSLFHLLPNFQPNILYIIDCTQSELEGICMTWRWHAANAAATKQLQHSEHDRTGASGVVTGIYLKQPSKYCLIQFCNWFLTKCYWYSALQCNAVFNAFSMKTPCGLLKMIHQNRISV